ncbi:hypothetical protein NW762_014814 [Fusarium torreyae]|uniref:Ankyrin repeat protein n=1 Tax=Fusarium torreyae TaxID=1237075 RepID=A0A9W8RL16_9HYPO|nr:hypothetical protein NW762_014814 [Fusarium torreyae]
MCWQDGYRSLSSLALTNSELRYNIITYVSQSAQLQFKWTLRKLYAFGIEDKHSIEILSDSTRTEEMDDDRSERPSERPQDMRQLRLRWRPATFAQGGFYMEQVAPVHTAIARGSTKMMEFLLTRRRSEKKRPGQSTPRSEKMLPSTFPGGISLTSLIKIAISAKQNDIAKSLIRRGGYMPDEDDLDTAAITGNKEMIFDLT